MDNNTTLSEDIGIDDFKDITFTLHLSDVTSVAIFLVVAAIILALTLYFGWNPDVPGNNPRKRVVIVTAFAADECLYFGPTILKLKDTCDVHILYFFEGYWSYLGRPEKNEIWNSCLNLGIPRQNITMIHLGSEKYPEDIWEPAYICRVLLDHIISHSFDEVYTMDVGVPRFPHQNYNLFFGFVYMALRDLIPLDCNIYVLKSVNLVRKYNFFLDSLISYFSKYLFVARLSDTRTIRDSIRMHTKEFTFYPFKIMYLSRYLYINTYMLLKKANLRYVLKMPEYDVFIDEYN